MTKLSVWRAGFLGTCVLSLLVAGAATPAEAPGTSLQIHSQYQALKELIEQTPVERMDEHWLATRIYQGFPGGQKLLKKILGEPGMAEKNMKMARLRQAVDIKFWAMVAKNKGWVIELVNQGKANGHRSDHDQTVWVLEGPNGRKPVPFQELQRMWSEHLGRHGFLAHQPDMSLFDGGLAIPDWANARYAVDTYISTLTRNVVEMRADAEAYYVPGANQEQVINRALEEGRSLRIAWDPEMNAVLVNGKTFDPDRFAAGQQEIEYLPAREHADFYRGQNPVKPWRLALGNLTQNLLNFQTHGEDPLSRQKYANRVIDGAFGRILSVTQTTPVGSANWYKALHKSNLSEQEKREKKDAFLRELYGDRIPQGQLDDIRRLFDTSIQIEADKEAGKPYIPDNYYGQWLSEAVANLRSEHPDISPEELRRRAMGEAERVFVQKTLIAFAEAAPAVLKHAIHCDLTAEGRRLHHSDFGSDPARYRENVRKMIAERQVEIALLFEMVERIENEDMRRRLRQNLLDTAPAPALRTLLEKLSDLSRAGRQAIDDWLRVSSIKGRIEAPDKFYKKLGEEVQRIVGNVEEAARSIPVRDAWGELDARAWVALGPEDSRKFRAARELLREAGRQAAEFGADYKEQLLENLNFYFYAGMATSLVRAYEQSCLQGGMTGEACKNAVKAAALEEAVWSLPYMDSYGNSIMALRTISEGKSSGFFTLGLSLLPRLGVGASAAQYYVVYKLLEGGFDITYGYVLSEMEEDILEQALRASIQKDRTVKRCGAGALVRADVPSYPLLGGEGEIRTPAEQMDQAERERQARARFLVAIHLNLLALGYTPLSEQWREEREKQIQKYACQLDYFERMDRLYPYLEPKIRAYAASAPANVRADIDTIFPVIEACVEREKRLPEEQRAGAPLAVCIPRGIEQAGDRLRPFFNRLVADWFAKQTPEYRAGFSSWFEQATEGNRVVEWVRSGVAWLGFDTELSKNRLSRKLVDTLMREYLFSLYTHEKRAELDWELQRQMAQAAKVAASSATLVRAIAAGQRDISELFAQAYVEEAVREFQKPVNPAAPKLRLSLPGYAVRLGEPALVEAKIAGECFPGGDEHLANTWSIDFKRKLEGTVEEKAPADLIVTRELAEELKGENKALYSLVETVTAELKDGSGKVLASATGHINRYDVLPKMKKAPETEPEQTPPTEIPSDLSGLLDELRRTEAQAAGAAGAMAAQCAEGRQAAQLAAAQVENLRQQAAQFEADARRQTGVLDGMKNLSGDAAQFVAKAEGAADAAATALGMSGALAEAGCQRLKSLSGLGSEAERQAVMAEVRAAVKSCADQVRSARSAVDAARAALAGCEAVRGEAAEALATFNDLAELRQRLQAGGAAVKVALDPASAAEKNARASQRQLEAARSNARQLAERGRRQLNSMTSNPEATRLLAEIDITMQRMEGLGQNVATCADDVAALVKAQDRAISSLYSSLEATAAQLEQARQSVQPQTLLQTLDEAVRRSRAALDSAQRFAGECEARAADAATCQAIAEELLRQNAVVPVPPVVGLTYPEARAAIEAAGLATGAAQRGSVASTSAAVGRVEGQWPAPGTMVQRGSAVAVLLYSDPPAQPAAPQPPTPPQYQQPPTPGPDAIAAEQQRRQANQQRALEALQNMQRQLEQMQRQRQQPQPAPQARVPQPAPQQRPPQPQTAPAKPQTGPVGTPVSPAEKKALEDEIVKRYADVWLKKWCTPTWSGCAILPKGAKDNLVDVWLFDAKTREEVNAVRNMFRCYDGCVLSGQPEAQINSCNQQCKQRFGYRR